MKKIVLVAKSIEQINKFKDLVDAFIIPIERLAVNYESYFSMENLYEIRRITKKELFISLNKNMHNGEIESLKDTLLELEKMDVEGILYYDIALVNLKQELGLKKNLVWSQEHLVTNYSTCNFWYEEGVKYAYLSSEITLDEINEISKNTKMGLMVNVFGYIPMFTSLRPVVENYLKTFKIEDELGINYMSKEGKDYPILSGENTTIFSSYILNGLRESLNMAADYMVINSFNIDDDRLLKVISMFREVNEGNVLVLENEINKMFDNVNKGFFHLETIYKVIK
ncbi:MAG: U32 family peptidase [Bacilli bacterium]|nr:U32 family peptidase [Bacilli bacterium]